LKVYQISQNLKWEFFNPVFEYHKEFNDFDYPWAGHIFVGYDIIRNLKPRKVVELGTYKGTSFFSFCQAAKDEGLDTEIVAIDCWKGDIHSEFYSEEIYKDFKKNLDRYYKEQNTKVMKMFFDQAIESFEDYSIDLLHIDGLHTYDAVKNDYEKWKDKVSHKGIIMFHDIRVTKDDFGVWKLWEELKKRNPDYTFIEMEHSHGLGIIIKSEKFKQLFTEDFKKYFVRHYALEHQMRKDLMELILPVAATT